MQENVGAPTHQEVQHAAHPPSLVASITRDTSVVQQQSYQTAHGVNKGWASLLQLTCTGTLLPKPEKVRGRGIFRLDK